MIESWNFIMFKDSIEKLLRHQLDQMMRLLFTNTPCIVNCDHQ